ncbi:MAG: glycosyltransferase family 4 protein [Butyrivibrio sp.]|nr:glycosyltransferase family 4 protein [Butyrivibrio sp.]
MSEKQIKCWSYRKVNITFLKLYRTNELNSVFYNSQEVGLAKALVKLHPEHHVDIVLLTKKSTELNKKNTGNDTCSITKTSDYLDEKQVENVFISDNITLHIIVAKGLGHHGIIELSILKKMKTDLVHLLADNMLFAPNVINYCYNNGIKCHLYIGTLFTDSKKWYKKALSRMLIDRNIRAYRKVDVYVKTPFVMSQCNKFGIDAKLAPVGLNASDTLLSADSRENIRQRFGLPNDKKILLFVGRLEEYKHPLEAIELLGKMSDFQLLIVGNGTKLFEVQKKADEMGILESIKIMSQIPNSEMRDIFKACDYYINFNPVEIYGMAILEAMCHKCPVLAIKAPGPEFLIENGETGFVCNDIEQMADKILFLENNREIYERIQLNAREHIINHLTWDKTVLEFRDFEHK